MSKFKFDEPCPACGYDNRPLEVRYCAGGDNRSAEMSDAAPAPMSTVAFAGAVDQACSLQLEGHHLHRRCARCQMEFSEEVVGRITTPPKS